MADQDPLPIRILLDFTDRINRVGIEYMLTGSFAMTVYSIYRYTADIDIVIDLKAEQVSGMVAAFDPDYYISADSAREAVRSRRMFNVINVETAFKVDCVITKYTDFQINAFERRSITTVFGRDIYVIGKEDLILSKLQWAADSRSEKQITDIANLLNGETDDAYLDLWAGKLGATELLEDCRQRANK